MTFETEQRIARGKPVRLGLVDCDIHPKNSLEDLRPYLSNRWWDHIQTFGMRARNGYARGYPYPKAQPQAARRDAWPPGGGLPASDLDFMRKQLLDQYGVDHAIMTILTPSGQGDQNSDLSAAVATAMNQWLIDGWTRREPRLKASIVVPYEDGEASRAEINRCAGERDFVQIQLMSRTSEPLGKKRYWPIYEAAVEHDLPVGIHVFGYSGWAITNGGWASFYIEEMTEHASSCQALVVSLIMEGVFERFPTLKIVLIESGFAWLPALGWRMDKHWARLRQEVPHLKEPPSHYLRKHFWVTTQPMEEAERPQHVLDVMEAIGWDRILFSTDYPHWDFDDPRACLPAGLDETRRRMILSGNARKLYGLD